MGKADRWLRAGLLFAFSCAAAAAFDLGRAAKGDAVPLFVRLLGPFLLPGAAYLLAPKLSALARLPRKRLLAVLFSVGLAPRLIASVLIPNQPVSDFAVYQEMSRALLAGQGFSLTGPAGLDDLRLYLGQDKMLPYPTAYRAPAVPLIGAALGASAAAFKLLNAVLGAGTSVLLFLLVESAAPSAACAASLLWSLYPAAVLAGNLYGGEVFFTFLLGLLAWLISRDEPLWAGLTAAACSLVRPMAVPLAAAAAAAWLWGRAGSDGSRRLGVFAAFLVLGVMPWTIRNAVLFRRLIPISTSEGIVFGIHSAFHLPDQARRDPELRARWAQFHAADEPDRARLGYRLGFYHLGLAAKAGPGFVIRRAVNDVVDSFGSDLDMLMWATAKQTDYRPGAPSAIVPAIGGGLLAALICLNHAFYAGLFLLAIRGLWRAPSPTVSGRGGELFLALHFLISFALFAVVPGVNRYHFPLMLAVTLFAARVRNSRLL